MYLLGQKHPGLDFRSWVKFMLQKKILHSSRKAARVGFSFIHSRVTSTSQSLPPVSPCCYTAQTQAVLPQFTFLCTAGKYKRAGVIFVQS